MLKNLSLANTNTTTYSVPICPVAIQPTLWEPNSYSLAIKVSTILSISVNILTMPLTLILNALVVIVVWKNASLHVERVVVLAYLALTDSLVGLICQPLFIAREIFHLENRSSNCSIDTVFFFCMFLFVGSSFYQLAVVTYERYIAIIHPYEYPIRITVKKLTYATIGLWTVDIVTVVLVIFWLRFASLFQIGVISIDALFRTFLIICIVYWYVHIFAAIRRQNRQIVQQQRNVSMNNPHTKQNHKGAITAALLVGVFLLSFIPLQVIIILRHVLDIQGSVLLTLQPWVYSSVMLSSAVNPLIYSLRYRELKVKCLKALGFYVQPDVAAIGNEVPLQPM